MAAKNLSQLTVAIFMIVLTSLCACGGGGSGEGGSKSSSTGVRVLHGVIDATPVDLFSSLKPGEVISRTRFATTDGYVAVGDGLQNLKLTRAKTPGVEIAQFSKNIDSAGRYSLLYYGNNSEIGLSTKLIDDLIPEGEGSTPLVRIVNGMTGAGAVNVSASRAYTVPYGTASPYLGTAVGPVRMTVSRSADSKLLFTGTVVFEESKAYTVFVAGDAEYYAKVVLLTDR